MRNILLAVMFIFSSGAMAAEFNLQFADPAHIHHNSNDWVPVAATSQYELHVNKSSVAVADTVVEIHTLVEFYTADGVVVSKLIVPVKQIYSRGVIECKNQILHLTTEWFVDTNNQIVYIQKHEIGTYAIDVSTKNTPRNDLYQLVCIPGS